MGSYDESVKKILEKYSVFEPAERDKLKCTITGHELPARAELLSSYVETAKFIRAFRVHEIMEEYGQYFDDLGENKYGCKITKRIVAKDPDDLKRHIEGKKFKAALEKADLDADEGDESSGGGSDVDMDGSEGFGEGIPLSREESSFLEDEEEEEDVEYPEFSNEKGESALDEDNYDFSVMDTEKDAADVANRKRKAETSSKRRKLKRKA